MTPFSFTLPSQQQDPTAAAGMQQYNAQGQGAIDPGRAPAMQSGQAPALGAALQQMVAKNQAQQTAQQNGQFAAGQQALSQGAQDGSVGPTVQNAALQQQVMQQNNIPQPQPSLMQQLGSYFGGSNGQ